MIRISPSLLACDFAHMADDVARVEQAGVELIHLDVMDGAFVPNFSFGNPVIAALRPHSRLIFDTHLMIEHPERYIKVFADVGSDIITVHFEACDDPRAVLEQIRSCGCRAGISVKPATPVSVLEGLMDAVDLILIMSVEPGFGGQKFMPVAIEKIAQAKALADRCDHEVDIEVDGGIGVENAALVAKAGANILVAGSAIFHAADVQAAVDAIRRAAEEEEA